MLMKERNYDFRKRMLEVHEKNIRNYNLMPNESEFVIEDGISIVIPKTAGDVMITAGKDFVDYLFTSMGVSANLKMGVIPNGESAVIVDFASNTGYDLKEANGYKGFRLDVEENIIISAFDERGAAQGLYQLEEIMSLRKAPFIPKETIMRKPLYSPCMVHSGYGLDEYPDEHLSAIAHEGRDAILIFVKDVDETPYGYLDFNELIYRAEKYGIDVYAYSYLESNMNPEEEGAEEYYDNLYGRLFEKCPGLKGVTLVGESVGFPSKDPNVTANHKENVDSDGLPLGKPLPGYWPCEDYPVWLNLLKKVIRKHNSEADIVFWTYNWGRQPRDARIRLIENLPTDISLMATFEMFEPYEIEGYREIVADYSLKFEGPGSYFKSEAEAAKRKGIKLYSMTNTGGLTWDIGVIPYEPMPQQWMRRYKAMKEAHDKWGLCGIMESHHYGFYPSFISKLSKRIFNNPEENMDKILQDVIVSEFGEKDTDKITAALNAWSEAIRNLTPTDPDQYGAFRIGPAFPFSFLVPHKNPCKPFAMFGNRIYHAYYNTWFAHEVILDKGSPVPIKLAAEIRSLEKMHAYIKEGLELLQQIEEKNDKLEELINLGEYIYCCVQTGINAKKWYKLISRFNNSESKEEVINVLNEMESLLTYEIENAEKAIVFAERDSRLGWEPSMEYMADSEHIKWKIKHAKYVINTEIAAQRNACK